MELDLALTVFRGRVVFGFVIQGLVYGCDIYMMKGFATLCVWRSRHMRNFGCLICGTCGKCVSLQVLTFKDDS